MLKNKMTGLLLLLGLLGQLHPLSASNPTFPADTPTEQIVADLFGTKWLSAKQHCLWTPTLAETLQFGNAYMHTHIDTVMDYTDAAGDRYRIIATATYESIEKESGYLDCHLCSPVLSLIKLKRLINDNKWELLAFDKYVMHYGHYGTAGSVRLLNLSKGHYVVEVKEFSEGQGYFSEHHHLLNMQDFHGCNAPLSFIAHADNSNSGDPVRQDYTTTMTLADGKICLHKTGKDITWDTANGQPNSIEVDTQTCYLWQEGRWTIVCE